MKLKLLLVGILVCFVIAVGCATAEKIGREVLSDVVDDGKAIVDEGIDKVKEKVAVKNYVVKKGDCLWNISAVQYGDPFLWWAIYKNNKDEIGDNPDLIEINQNFKIRYDYSNIENYNFKQKAYNYGE